MFADLLEEEGGRRERWSIDNENVVEVNISTLSGTYESTNISRPNLRPLLFYFFTQLVIKLVAKLLFEFYGVGAFELVAVRGEVGVLLSLSYVKISHIPLFNVDINKANPLLISSFLGLCNYCFTYLALQFLPITLTLSTEYLASLFFLYFTTIFYYSTMRVTHILAYCSAAAGTLFIVANGSSTTAYGMLFGILSSFCRGTYSVVMKNILLHQNEIKSVVFLQLVTVVRYILLL